MEQLEAEFPYVTEVQIWCEANGGCEDSETADKGTHAVRSEHAQAYHY
jgi:hypothetical protein